MRAGLLLLGWLASAALAHAQILLFTKTEGFRHPSTVDDATTFSACDAIDVGPGVLVSGPNGDATFEAANTVAFGNGVEIGFGAGLTVTTGRSLYE